MAWFVTGRRELSPYCDPGTPFHMNAAYLRPRGGFHHAGVLPIIHERH
jgi:hypothetical protein